jgi:beta-glucosidase
MKMRNPKGGRGWERRVSILEPQRSFVTDFLCSFGPDPYLQGEGAFETIVGVQSVGVQACAKHFIGNNQEHWRYGLTANINDRTLHEIYFYPFLRSIEVNLTNPKCIFKPYTS